MRDYFTPPPKTYIRLLAPSDSSISVFSKNSPYNTIYEHVNIMKATKPAGWTQRERVVSTCFALLKLWFFKKQLPLKDGSKMRQRTFGVAWTMTKVSTVIRFGECNFCLLLNTSAWFLSILAQLYLLEVLISFSSTILHHYRFQFYCAPHFNPNPRRV